jgi:hypothetical protein
LIVLLLSAVAAAVPFVQFLRVLPEIAILYNHELVFGWGMYLMLAGLVMVMAFGGLLAFVRPAPELAPKPATLHSRKEQAA